MVTLEQLKKKPLGKITEKKLDAFFQHNRQVARSRMENGKIDWEVHDMTHDGNNIMDNKTIINRAKLYLDYYTDEEWEKYFLPAINKAIKYNNKFERWFPGYLIKNKEDGTLAIVEYDYDYAFGHQCFGKGHNWVDLSLCFLDDKGKIKYSSAWHDYEDYELVDKDNTDKYIQMMRKYNKRIKEKPYYLDPQVDRLLY